MSFSLWLAFISTTFFISASPGPNMLLAFQFGINYGVKKTIYTLLGLSTGLLILLGISALAVSILSQKAPVVFEVAKLLGAAYLLYLAYQSWHSKGSGFESNQIRIQPSKSRLYRTGLGVALSNPKAILFFAAFFPHFLRPEQGSIGSQYAILIVSFFIIETFWQCIYTVLGKILSIWLLQNNRILWLNRICGGIFAVIAIGLVVDGIQNISKLF